ncbi:hypothetical protein HOD08_01790 [bacterium]|nr:hypothetical protein [bacterium]
MNTTKKFFTPIAIISALCVANCFAMPPSPKWDAPITDFGPDVASPLCMIGLHTPFNTHFSPRHQIYCPPSGSCTSPYDSLFPSISSPTAVKPLRHVHIKKVGPQQKTSNPLERILVQCKLEVIGAADKTPLVIKNYDTILQLMLVTGIIASNINQNSAKDFSNFLANFSQTFCFNNESLENKTVPQQIFLLLIAISPGLKPCGIFESEKIYSIPTLRDYLGQRALLSVTPMLQTWRKSLTRDLANYVDTSDKTLGEIADELFETN